MSPTARRIVSRLEFLGGNSRTAALGKALGLPYASYDAALDELVGLGKLMRFRGVGATVVLA